ncbi:Holo-(acyl-carrier-protein) synthase [uncultured Gammaproteobacteria bacterium]
MIIGIGNDLIDIGRIERTLERFGDRFLERVFTDGERDKAERRAHGGSANRAASYAKRFAAKEACAKALGTGFSAGVFWRDLAVITLPGGRPGMELSGGASVRLHQLTPPGMIAAIHLTLTDEPPLAAAVVVIEAVPNSL